MAETFKGLLPNARDMNALWWGGEKERREGTDAISGLAFTKTPVQGTVVATSATSVLLKAGEAAVADRSAVIIRNVSPFEVKVGPSSTAAIYKAGIPVGPGEERVFRTASPLYARSEGGEVELEVTEL
ncbi:MAG: hypothetical protein SPF89_11285 [Sphaerochaetaceae bacterium]|nr:hypothetical protein [Spirochaetales bacterium]MDY5500679.1 hypothetical protein [Sphaerochaetaceae bacterium]